MSENCNQICSSCSEDCAERQEQKTDFSEKLHEISSVKKVIGVVSGKGGVGKSLVTSMLALPDAEYSMGLSPPLISTLPPLRRSNPSSAMPEVPLTLAVPCFISKPAVDGILKWSLPVLRFSILDAFGLLFMKRPFLQVLFR